MYASAAQYLGDVDSPPMLNPDKLYVEPFKMHKTKHAHTPLHKIWHKTPVQQPHIHPQKETDKTSLDLTWKDEHIENTADPRVWGPMYWITQHISAAHYPLNASPIVRERMKQRILAVPHEIPCHSCKSHASAFIESKRPELDEIVKGRHSLGKFWVDFHNKVNERYGKRKWSYDEAYKKYSGGAKITVLK